MQFIIIDLDKERMPTQQLLVQRYYTGYIPHVVVLDANGKPKYDRAGEVDSKVISELLDSLVTR